MNKIEEIIRETANKFEDKGSNIYTEEIILNLSQNMERYFVNILSSHINILVAKNPMFLTVKDGKNFIKKAVKVIYYEKQDD